MTNRIILIVIFCTITSLIGTMIGALIGISVKKPSNKLLGGTIAFAGGMMLIISIIELIPKAIEKNGFSYFVIFFIIGMICILVINYISDSGNTDSHVKVAFLIALGLMIHNFPEGLIMGFGFMTEGALGIKMSLLIAIHDIPEGMAVAAPLRASKVSSLKIILYAFLSSLPAVIGALIAIILGNVSSYTIGISLAMASGIMIYVVLFQMTREAKLLSGLRVTIIGMLIGIIFGSIMTKIL